MHVTFRCNPELADSIPRPMEAKRALPDWLRTMPSQNMIEGFGPEKTVKQCPPFVDAMTAGFIIPLAVDIRVARGRFTWDWEHADAPLGLHFASQLAGTPLASGELSALKILNFWSIETEPGIATLFTHPFNRLDLPFRTISGLVDTDTFHTLPVNFPIRWTDMEFEGVLPAGTPAAQCIPVRREAIEMAFETNSEERRAEAQALKDLLSHEDNHYRTHIRQPRP